MYTFLPTAGAAAPALRLLLATSLTTVALAGGTGNNALLIVDPTDSDSLFFANYYRAARDIPAENILYMTPGAADLAEFADTNLVALHGELARRDIADHIDSVIVMPTDDFYINAGGLFYDACFPPSRVSLGTAYSLAFTADDILNHGGDYSSLTVNQYASFFGGATGFSAQNGWQQGSPTTSPFAQRIYLGSMLGYTGSRGNTREEIVDMIDRSVAVDGTFPSGTFYFMQTDDPLRSPPRHNTFPNAESIIENNGGSAEILFAEMPEGRQDCLGIMTGTALPRVDNANITIQPGAFCDHLTSFAARFDTSSQEKASRWIANGASGSFGTVEEPCNWGSKFPHAVMHAHYIRGLTLGEAVYRSLGAVPFQGLLLGDPLTRPFADIPAVTVNNLPTGPVAGVISLTPTMNVSGIADVHLLVDGVIVLTRPAGLPFSLDTRNFDDGWHEIRFEAVRNNAPRTGGRWRGELEIANDGVSVALAAVTTVGDTTSEFQFVADASQTPREYRLIHNGRVVARGGGESATLTVPGSVLGAGPVELYAEAYYGGDYRVRSELVTIEILEAGTLAAPPTPIAVSYTRGVSDGDDMLLELPTRFRGDLPDLTYEIVTPPQRGSLDASRGGPFAIYTPATTNDCGNDSFRFRVRNGSAVSNIATVWIDYGLCDGDLNCDGAVSVSDIGPFVLALAQPANYAADYAACDPLAADFSGDGFVTVDDISGMVDLLISN